MQIILAGLLCTLFLAAGSPVAAAGTLKGRIHFKGEKPAPVKLNMSADKRCGRLRGGEDVYSDQVVVNDNNTLKNVFIYVKNGLKPKKYTVPDEMVSLDQTGCMYRPRVFGIMVGQNLEITNNDETFHNVHAVAKNSEGFNIGQPNKGMKRIKTFSRPEVMVKIKCDVHNWMAAYAGVMEHPFFAVSDDEGSFTIPDLPAGEYEIETWHEKYGTKTMKVSVGASDVKTADFTYEIR